MSYVIVAVVSAAAGFVACWFAQAPARAALAEVERKAQAVKDAIKS
jgi:hypothetical protein